MTWSFASSSQTALAPTARSGTVRRRFVCFPPSQPLTPCETTGRLSHALLQLDMEGGETVSVGGADLASKRTCVCGEWGWAVVMRCIALRLVNNLFFRDAGPTRGVGTSGKGGGGAGESRKSAKARRRGPAIPREADLRRDFADYHGVRIAPPPIPLFPSLPLVSGLICRAPLLSVTCFNFSPRLTVHCSRPQFTDASTVGAEAIIAHGKTFHAYLFEAYARAQSLCGCSVAGICLTVAQQRRRPSHTNLRAAHSQG